MLSEANSATTAVYQYDEALRTLETSIIAIEPISALNDGDKALFKQAQPHDFVVQTGETIFFAQGGGQPFDTGCMEKTTAENGHFVGVFKVRAVRNASNGKILHLGSFEDGETKSLLAKGDLVRQSIDGTKRDMHSRIHTAGHILGLAVRQLASSIPGIAELKAQHYPDSAFVEFQGLIDGKHKDAIQKKVNELVKDNLPVHVYWWDKNTARARCVFFPEEIGGNPQSDTIRVMDVEGVGAYPCGGTHVLETSAVGNVQIRKIKRQNGITKISYMVE